MSTVSNMTQDQRLLLEKINQYSEPNRRTDQLATCMRQFGKQWDNSHTAFVGLSLRALGFATTFKDQSQYAQWNITPLGKAALCELKNMRKPASVPTAVKYAVFDTYSFAFQRFDTLDQAEKAAAKWAEEAPGADMVVMQVLHAVKAKVVVEKV